MVSHLTTLVNRFLATLENMRRWNYGLQRISENTPLEGEKELKHHLANIIEYVFYVDKVQTDLMRPNQFRYDRSRLDITFKEVERLVNLLEGRKQN